MKKYILILLPLIVVILLTACGRGGDETANQDGVPVRDGGTLRVFAPISEFRPMLNAAILEISRTKGVEVELFYFNPLLRGDYWAQNLPQAIANGEFDIIFADPRFPLFDMARDGLFANVFDLIDFCPRFAIHDFYHEALH
ncbi:MAG: hypothetical protein FWC32_00975, partial [Firmicutes bacterium]|nr:hypothetical protein [Bacillota bacterium]